MLHNQPGKSKEEYVQIAFRICIASCKKHCDLETARNIRTGEPKDIVTTRTLAIDLWFHE